MPVEGLTYIQAVGDLELLRVPVGVRVIRHDQAVGLDDLAADLNVDVGYTSRFLSGVVAPQQFLTARAINPILP